MLADGLEYVLHRDRFALESAGQDRAAIDEDRRHVQPAHHHHHSRQRLVAAGKSDQSVIGMTAHGQFHRVGDHFARRQRGFHALVAHGDPVGDRDGAEFARRAAGGRDALLDCLRLAHQRDVAGSGFVPAGGDTHEWLMNLLAREPHGIIVRAVRRALGPLGHVPAGQPCLEVLLRVHGSSRLRLVGTLGSAPAIAECKSTPASRSRRGVWLNRGADCPESYLSLNVLAVLPASNRINEWLTTKATVTPTVLGGSPENRDRSPARRAPWRSRPPRPRPQYCR